MSVGLVGRKKLRKLFKLRMDYMNNGQEIGKMLSNVAIYRPAFQVKSP